MRVKIMFNEKTVYLGRNGKANAIGIDVIAGNKITTIAPRYKRDSDKDDKPASCFIQIPNSNVVDLTRTLLDSFKGSMPSKLDYLIIVQNVSWYRFRLKSKLKSLGFSGNSKFSRSYIIYVDSYKYPVIRDSLFINNIQFACHTVFTVATERVSYAF